MRKMTYAFYASFKAPSVGVQEVRPSTPDAQGRKVRVYKKGVFPTSHGLLLLVNKLQQLIGTFLKLPYDKS